MSWNVQSDAPLGPPAAPIGMLAGGQETNVLLRQIQDELTRKYVTTDVTDEELERATSEFISEDSDVLPYVRALASGDTKEQTFLLAYALKSSYDPDTSYGTYKFILAYQRAMLPYQWAVDKIAELMRLEQDEPDEDQTHISVAEDLANANNLMDERASDPKVQRALDEYNKLTKRKFAGAALQTNFNFQKNTVAELSRPGQGATLSLLDAGPNIYKSNLRQQIEKINSRFGVVISKLVVLAAIGRTLDGETKQRHIQNTAYFIARRVMARHLVAVAKLAKTISDLKTERAKAARKTRGRDEEDAGGSKKSRQ